MRYQIQIRGDGGGAVEWRPISARVAGEATTFSTTFSTWDEAEDELDRLQLSGVIPLAVEGSGIELRIVDVTDRRRSRRAEGATHRDLLVRTSGARASA